MEEVIYDYKKAKQQYVTSKGDAQCDQMMLLLN